MIRVFDRFCGGGSLSDLLGLATPDGGGSCGGNWRTQEPGQRGSCCTPAVLLERADDGLRCGRQRGRRSGSDVCRSRPSRANEFTRRNIVVRRSDADVIRGVPYMKRLSNLLLVEEAVIAAAPRVIP
jgi:hypothetical protein